jgi:hypothetical protein
MFYYVHLYLFPSMFSDLKISFYVMITVFFMAPVYQPPQCDISEDYNLHIHTHENLRSQVDKFWFVAD